MNRLALLVALLVISSIWPASAAIYRWVDQEGKVRFSDQAPAEDAAEAQRVNVAPAFEGNTAATSPSAVSEAGRGAAPAAAKPTRSFPKVELYTTSWCPWCRKAASYLQTNRVPYTEYDVETDSAAAARFKSLNPRGGVPFAVIGGEKIGGFDTQGYARALGLGR